MTDEAILIAVVDDEESVVRALHRLLRSAGLDVLAYSNGQAFLDALADHHFDCVVLDLHMPEVDGFEVQTRLAEAGASMPQVIITGHDTPEAHRRAIDGGASAYLRKPVDGPALLNTIDALVRGKTSSDSNP
ncbi:MAG: response regulator [Planctomycetes bacterium]|nr:response regulator [Planctomycetota bacterium]